MVVYAATPSIMKTKLIPLLLVTLFWAAVGTGCNTTRGVGQDIERAGEKIQQNASR